MLRRTRIAELSMGTITIMPDLLALRDLEHTRI